MQKYMKKERDKITSKDDKNITALKRSVANGGGI